MTPTRADVVAAATRIRDHVHRTPVLTSRTVDARLGAEFYFKCENLQRMGAFKVRGATNAVRLLPDAVETVATHSSGNHGAALALAAAEVGLRAIIVVPSDARESKRSAIERYGAEVVTCEPTLASREATLRRVVTDTGAVFVPPYDHRDIIAGAGTSALELLEQVPGLDQVWVPVGGGGLAAGTVLAVGDAARVVLAEPELAADAQQSLSSGVLQGAMPPVSVADGLRTGPGQAQFLDSPRGRRDRALGVGRGHRGVGGAPVLDPESRRRTVRRGDAGGDGREPRRGARSRWRDPERRQRLGRVGTRTSTSAFPPGDQVNASMIPA